MSNDKTTLADVQPGGRVRLGGELPPLPDFGINTANHASVRVRGFTAEQMLDYARAALSAQPSQPHQIDAETLWWLQDAINAMAEGGNQSHIQFLQRLHDSLAAQPSPGGQGDAREQFEEYRGGDCERDAQGYYTNARTAQDWAMWQAALAARQPVGEPFAYGSSAGHQPILASVYYPDNAACRELYDIPLYTAAPAHAVDLGSVRAALQAAEALCVCCASVDGYSRSELNAFGQNMRSQFTDALALIDSQAVGNG